MSAPSETHDYHFMYSRCYGCNSNLNNKLMITLTHSNNDHQRAALHIEATVQLPTRQEMAAHRWSSQTLLENEFVSAAVSYKNGISVLYHIRLETIVSQI